MRRSLRAPFALLALLLPLSLAACSSDPTPTTTADASVDGTSVDATSIDAPSVDATVDTAREAMVFMDTATEPAPFIDVVTPPDASDAMPVDAGNDTSAEASVDAAVMRDGSTEILGTLRGTCGTLRGMLHTPAPSLVRNELLFMAPERYARDTLSPGGQRLFDTANAGGSSSESEVMSYEVLHFCDDAELLATETEIRYQPPDDSGANSITDILVTIGGERVGVSVTRAYVPMPMMLTDATVRDLLTRKLVGINRSSMRVLPEHRWVKQILHVFTANAAAADAVARIWATLDATTRADTIVVLTSTVGGGFIYCNPDPMLGAECPPIGG